MKYCCELCGTSITVSEKVYRRKMLLYCSSCQTATEYYPYEFPQQQEFMYDGDEYFIGRIGGECFWCHQPTKYVSICFEGFICGPKCSNAAWDDYWSLN